MSLNEDFAKAFYLAIVFLRPVKGSSVPAKSTGIN